MTRSTYAAGRVIDSKKRRAGGEGSGTHRGERERKREQDSTISRKGREESQEVKARCKRNKSRARRAGRRFGCERCQCGKSTVIYSKNVGDISRKREKTPKPAKERERSETIRMALFDQSYRHGISRRDARAINVNSARSGAQFPIRVRKTP